MDDDEFFAGIRALGEMAEAYSSAPEELQPMIENAMDGAAAQLKNAADQD